MRGFLLFVCLFVKRQSHVIVDRTGLELGVVEKVAEAERAEQRGSVNRERLRAKGINGKRF